MFQLPIPGKEKYDNPYVLCMFLMSLYNTIHFIPKKKRYHGLSILLHCSSPLSTKILQSCGVILQNIPLISAQVLNKYMYFVHNYRSACVHVCVPITEASDLSVSLLFMLPQSLLYIHFCLCFELSCILFIQ